MSEALVLASRSPQRRAILEQLGIRHTVLAPDVEERRGGDPRSLVTENAALKARAVEGELVLGVDTTVALDGQAYGKPADEAEAEATLTRLSGRSHQVLSGICLRSGRSERTSCVSTRVHFRSLAEHELRWYLASGEWRDRAGGYAIQGRGAALVASIEGDFWNVVGLPVPTLLALCPGLLADRG
ncbi:MAG: Maf family protein [Thermoleophilaceae bacterium]